MQCPYCKGAVVVPAEVRQAATEAATAQEMQSIAPWVKWFGCVSFELKLLQAASGSSRLRVQVTGLMTGGTG